METWIWSKHPMFVPQMPVSKLVSQTRQQNVFIWKTSLWKEYWANIEVCFQFLIVHKMAVWTFGQNDLQLFSSAASLLNNMDMSVDPCVDFFDYTCGKYVQNTPIKETGRTSVFTEIQDSLKFTVKGRSLSFGTESEGFGRKPIRKFRIRLWHLVIIYMWQTTIHFSNH